PPRATPFELYNDRLPAEPTKAAKDAPEEEVIAPSTLDIVVRRMREAGEQAHQIWLPPLPSALTLDEVTGPLTADPAYGLTVADPMARGRLRIPLGLLDKPTQQLQEPFMIDLAGGAGHLCVLGAPQSGKSTLLRTLIASAALTHTPADLSFYCVD